MDLQEAALGDSLEEFPKDPGRGGGNSTMQDLVDVTMKDPGWREVGEEAGLSTHSHWSIGQRQEGMTEDH